MSQSIEAVKLWQFIIATCCVFPKILLHTFIGSKIAELSDVDQRGQMDTRVSHFIFWLIDKCIMFYQVQRFLTYCSL